MQIARFKVQDTTHWGAVQGDHIVVLDGWCASLPAAIAQGWQAIRQQAGSSDHPRVAVADVHWLPPAQLDSKILCVGLNYGRHVAETGRAQASHPSLFFRHLDSFVGHQQNIVKPASSDQFDFEGELVVVIGREGRHIPEADAMAYVAGYTCMGENSVRDFQKHTAQVTAGKNFDQSGSLGPWVVPHDIVASPSELTVTTRLNDQQVQHGSLADLIFSVPRLVAYASSFTTLRPGDMIATGTPEGIGSKRTPPLFMKPGDTLEIEVPGIGVLRTPVVAETAPSL